MREPVTEEPADLPVKSCTHGKRRCGACWTCSYCPPPAFFLQCRGSDRAHGRSDGSKTRRPKAVEEKEAAALAAVPYQEHLATLQRDARPVGLELCEAGHLTDAELGFLLPVQMGDISSALRLADMPVRPFTLEKIQSNDGSRSSVFKFLDSSVQTIAEASCPGAGGNVLSMFYDARCPRDHGREGDMANALLHNMVPGCRSVPNVIMQRVLAGALLHFSGMTNREFSALIERDAPQEHDHRFGGNSDWRFLKEGRAAFEFVQDGGDPFAGRAYACRVSQAVVDGVIRFVIKMFDVKVGVKRTLQVADSERFNVQQHVLTMTAKEVFRIYVQDKGAEYLRSLGITAAEAEVSRELAKHRAGRALFCTILHMTTTARVSRACLSYYYTNFATLLKVWLCADAVATSESADGEVTASCCVVGLVRVELHVHIRVATCT